MPDVPPCYEDKRRVVPAVVYDIGIGPLPFLEILAYQTEASPQNQAASAFDEVVEETFFHMLKNQDRRNVKGIARLLLRNGMRTYIFGDAVKTLLVGKPRSYKNLWILGVPWNDDEGEGYRLQFINFLEDYAKKQMLLDLDDEGIRRFQVVEEKNKKPATSNHPFKLVPVPEGLVQKFCHKLLRPSKIYLTFSPRESFKQLR